MHATTVAIDLAKDVFELCFADDAGRVLARKRLRRGPFGHALDNLPVLTVVMEACGSAHYWGRRFERLGHRVVLLPAQHSRPFVRGNKTDRSDVAGLLTAFLVGGIRPVPLKSEDQQGPGAASAARAPQASAHRVDQRRTRIVARVRRDDPSWRSETAPRGARRAGGWRQRHPKGAASSAQRPARRDRSSRQRDASLAEFAQRDLRSQRFQVATGIGLITATALSASQGELDRFPTGRHFASSLGLTPKEFSSGTSRRLGKLTRRGDIYLRTLLIHGARSLLQRAALRQRRDEPLDRLSEWALRLAERIGRNKAACAVANKLARRLWAAEHHRTTFDPNHVSAVASMR